ncbi:MAG: hypothetical protein CVV51_09995 [Spirochaetae bacterium HGW-Spirochaetae-7]|jgi:hypothetical protein|nr:MAG: hypothetical protein CVV51_09995 [Spirochaetae bacterium HGW-Spirochaetae-7]
MSDGKGRRVAIAVFAIVVMILAYFFVCTEPLSAELSAVPRWRIDIAATAETALPAGESVEGLLSYSTDTRHGYFWPDGRVAFMADEPAAISDKSYVIPSRNGSGSMLKVPGKPAGLPIEAHLPFFAADKLYSAELDGSGFAAWDQSGRKSWSYAFPCQLSAFSAGDTLAVGGTVDGWLEGVTVDGRKAFSFAPGGSRLSVILGLGVSRSGDWIAAISGIDRQRLVVLGRGGADFRVTSHRYLDSDYREPVRVIVMSDDRHVLYRRTDGIGVWSVDGKVDEVLPVKADDFDVHADGERGLAYLVARRGRKSEIVVFRLPATLLGRISLPDSSDYVRFVGSSAYVGGRTWLARFDFVEG